MGFPFVVHLLLIEIQLKLCLSAQELLDTDKAFEEVRLFGVDAAQFLFSFREKVGVIEMFTWNALSLKT